MADQLLLPPHVETEGDGFYDAAKDAAAMDAVPLQDYSSEWTAQKAAEQTPTEPVAADPKPESEAPKTDAMASAKEFIELYDMGQAWGFHFYSQGKDPKHFELAPFPKERAIHHLAKGLEKMGVVEVPWWIGLTLALTPPAFANFMTAKVHREEQERSAQAQAERNQRATEHGHPARPHSATTADGRIIPLVPPEPKHMAPALPPASLPPCEVCGTPVKKKGRRFCGQICSGKGSGTKKTAQI